MTQNDRLHALESLNWHFDDEAGRHQICAERCVWIMGSIGGVSHSAWMSEVSGMVYLHAGGAPEDRDFEFDAFVAIVGDGWPVKLTKTQARGFDFGDDE